MEKKLSFLDDHTTVVKTGLLWETNYLECI